IFLALGGTAFKLGTFEIVKFPGVYVYLNMPQGAPPSAGGNDGAVVNQVGVAVQSLQETAARLKASGVQVQPGVNGRTDQAFMTIPDGLSIEIVEDKNQKVPVQHRNIQFSVTESSIPEIQSWYAKVFSAKPRSDSGRRNTRSESEVCESRQADRHHQGAGARPHRIRCEESRGALE